MLAQITRPWRCWIAGHGENLVDAADEKNWQNGCAVKPNPVIQCRPCVCFVLHGACMTDRVKLPDVLMIGVVPPHRRFFTKTWAASKGRPGAAEPWGTAAAASLPDEEVGGGAAPVGRPRGLHGGAGRVELRIGGQLGVRGQVCPAAQQLHHHRHCTKQRHR